MNWWRFTIIKKGRIWHDQERGNALRIDKGAWDVYPSLTSPSINIDKNIIIKLLKTNQRLKAFSLGDIISDEHGIESNNILPNPPINIGIIIEDIINIPWKLILGLYWRDEHSINPGKANSNRNIIDNPKPIEPPINPVIIYTAPI